MSSLFNSWSSRTRHTLSRGRFSVRQPAGRAHRSSFLFGRPHGAFPGLAVRDATSRPVKPPGASPSDLRESGPEYGGGRLVCAACGHFITRREFAVRANGARLHTFCNPHGLVFEIALFSQAPGCLVLGPPCLEFTWFPGYAWSVACCGGCAGQLGWRYDSVSDEGFFGIVAERIVTEKENGAGM